VTGKQGGRRKQLLDELKEKTEYWKLKKEALYFTLENSLCKRLGACRKIDKKMNEWTNEHKTQHRHYPS